MVVQPLVPVVCDQPGSRREAIPVKGVIKATCSWTKSDSPDSVGAVWSGHGESAGCAGAGRGRSRGRWALDVGLRVSLGFRSASDWYSVPCRVR